MYTLSLIFQKFSRHFELHPLWGAGPRQKHVALIIIFFSCVRVCFTWIHFPPLFPDIPCNVKCLKGLCYTMSHDTFNNCIGIK